MPSFIASRILNIPLIYHIHDVSDRKGMGFLGKIIDSFEKRYLRYSYILSMPNKERLEYYSIFKKLPEKTCEILNSVSIEEDFNKESRILKLANEKKNIKKWIVRTGGLGDDQCIKETIIALNYLPESVGLALAGPITRDFKEELIDLIEKNNLKERVILFEHIPRDEVLGFLKYASLGISLYKPFHKYFDINLLYPCPTKLAECIASGIPAVVNDNEYFRRLNEKVKSFVFADPYSPESIANAIREVIENPEKERILKENAKNAYKNFYNFEYQFEPVLREIEKWIKR